jgi:hypothetical protein
MNLHLYNGYYEYNNNIYTVKESVLDEMLLRNDASGKYNFVFHDELFSKLDWTVEPEISLMDLYIARAKQIREEYDYVILSYSGGSDSYEVLRVFLDNNIFIDEIQTSHYSTIFDGIKHRKNLTTQMKRFNEFEFNVVPTLDEIKKKSPYTKINLMDASRYLIEDTVGKKYNIFGHKTDKPMTNYPLTRFPRTYFAFQHLENEKSLEKKQNVCMVLGLEKPFLTLKGETLYCYFGDSLLQGIKYLNRGFIDPYLYKMESFFTSHKAPLIPIKQSHVLKRAFEANVELYKSFLSYLNIGALNFNNRDRFEFTRKYVPYIYHHWDNTKIFLPKPFGKSQDYSLIEYLFKTDAPFQAAKEYNEFIIKKYEKVADKPALVSEKRSKQYRIGEIKHNFVEKR